MILGITYPIEANLTLLIRPWPHGVTMTILLIKYFLYRTNLIQMTKFKLWIHIDTDRINPPFHKLLLVYLKFNIHIIGIHNHKPTHTWLLTCPLEKLQSCNSIVKWLTGQNPLQLLEVEWRECVCVGGGEGDWGGEISIHHAKFWKFLTINIMIEHISDNDIK